jgi:beta-phosphoglucomutase-like phosphatase (HAD superfamily)
MQIKAILFDIDGTLVDSNDMHVLAWEGAFAGIGATFDRQVVHDQIGKGTDMLVSTLLPDLDEAAQEKLGGAHGCIFKAKFLGEAKPFKQAHDLLAHAHGLGQLVVLASSASGAELEHYLDLLEARALVAAVTSSDDVERTKPAPDIFATALAKLSGIDAGSAGRWRHALRHRGCGKVRDGSRCPSIREISRRGASSGWGSRDLRRRGGPACRLRRLTSRALKQCRSKPRSKTSRAKLSSSDRGSSFSICSPKRQRSNIR